MFLPNLGDIMTVMLPNELIRATVVAILDEDTVVAKLDQAYPFSRIHNYQFNQVLRFKREPNSIGPGEKWMAIDEAPILRPVAPPPPRPSVAPDEHEALPPRPKIKTKAKRRSDMALEAGKKK